MKDRMFWRHLQCDMCESGFGGWQVWLALPVYGSWTVSSVLPPVLPPLHLSPHLEGDRDG